MNKLQKLLLSFFIMAAAVLCMGQTQTQAATFSEAKIATISDASEIEKVDALYTQTCSLGRSEVQEDYFSFTLKKDSWVYMSVSYSQYDTNSSETQVQVFSNESMNNQKMAFSGFAIGNNTKETNGFFSAGTYYVYVRTTCKYEKTFNANVDIVGAAIPVDKIFTYSTKVSKKMDSATVTMKCALGKYVKYVQFRPDTIASEDLDNGSYWKHVSTGCWYDGDENTQVLDKQNGGYSTSVTQNGKVTFLIMTTASDRYAGICKVTGIDTKKPTISGVKNGKTYKKAVTITFSDDASGVKSAKLNGKSIKSGKTVSASGSYTLVVTDKAGNKKTIKFKIK